MALRKSCCVCNIDVMVSHHSCLRGPFSSITLHANPTPGVNGSVERIINFSFSSGHSSKLILFTCESFYPRYCLTMSYGFVSVVFFFLFLNTLNRLFFFRILTYLDMSFVGIGGIGKLSFLANCFTEYYILLEQKDLPLAASRLHIGQFAYQERPVQQ